MSFSTEFIKAFNNALNRSDASDLDSPFSDFCNNEANLDKNSKDYEKAYFELLKKEGLIDDSSPDHFKESFPLFIERLRQKDRYVASVFFNIKMENLEDIYNNQNRAYLLAAMSSMIDLAKVFDNPSITDQDRELAFKTACTSGNTVFALELLAFENVQLYVQQHQELLLNLVKSAVQKGQLEIVKQLVQLVTIKSDIAISLLKEAIKANRLPIIEFLLSMDSIKTTIASQANEVLKTVLAKNNLEVLEAFLKNHLIQEMATSTLPRISRPKELALLLQGLKFFNATKNEASIESISDDIISWIENNNEIYYQSREALLGYLNRRGINEGALQEKIISLMFSNIVYNLPDSATNEEIAALIRNHPGNIRDIYDGKDDLTLEKLADSVLHFEKDDYASAGLNLNPLLMQKIEKNLWRKDFKNANESSITEIIKQYPGKASEIAIAIQVFNQTMNNPVEIRNLYIYNSMYTFERHGLDSIFSDKFLALARKKYLCQSPDFIQTIAAYKGPISDLIQNNSYQSPTDVADWIKELVENENSCSLAYTHPENILALLQEEGLVDKDIQQTILRIMQEKTLSLALLKTTTYLQLEQALINYPSQYFVNDQCQAIDKELAIVKLQNFITNPEKQTDAFYYPEVILAELGNIAPSFVVKNYLRLVKLNYEEAQKKAIQNYPTASFLHTGEPLRFALAHNMFSEAQALYEKGARLPYDTLKKILEDARKQKELNKVDFIVKLFDLKQDPLFANVDELKLAAIYANKHFLANPYSNGLNAARWENQRAIALLEDNTIVDVPPECLYGIPIAIELANSKQSGDLVTFDEIIEEAFQRGISLSKEKIGQVDVAALEAHVGQKVQKVKYRPNHDLQHSLRAAAFIYPLYQMFNTHTKREDQYTSLSNGEIEALQLMMLFSVLGREDETGFGDSKDGGSFLYQSYRAVDAFEFLSYCLANWDRHYHNVFSDKAALFQAALAIELMGYPTMPKEIESIVPRPLMSILMQGYSEDNFKLLKETIYQDYPHNNILRTYTDDQLKALFSDHTMTYQNARSDTYLSYMNAAHGSDLLRCYDTGDPLKLNNPGGCISNLLYFYSSAYESLSHQGKLNEISPAKRVTEYFQLVRGMLNEFGEKRTTDCELDDRILKEALDCAILLEEILTKYKGKPFEEVKDLKFDKKIKVKTVEVETLTEFLNQFALSEDVKQGIGLLPPGQISEKTMLALVPRFLAHSFLKTGSFSYTLGAFDHCHYKINKVQGIEDPQCRDLEKEVTTSLRAIAEIPRPTFCRKSNFEMDEALKHKMLEVIHSACKEGVAVFKSGENITLEFFNQAAAESTLTALLRLGKIANIPTINLHSTAPHVATVQISVQTYSIIKPLLKFRMATVAAKQSVESTMVTSTGTLAIQNLIGEYNAVVCNHNSVVSPGGTQTGVDWYVNQLQNPSTNRPTRLSTLTEEERSKVHSMLPSQQGEQYSVNRELIAPLPLERQEPRTQPLENAEYWENEDNPKARAVFRVRGQPKNTLFAKKSAHTMMVPRGQTLFQGLDVCRYFPLGIISDVNAMHTIGERYIWTHNADSNDKFWIGDRGSVEALKEKQGVTLSRLREHLQEHDQMSELLLGGAKSAISALACSGDLEAGNKTTLSYRLNLVTQAIFLREKYGIDVPLVMIEGDKAPYLYTEQMLLTDITRAIQELKRGNYPYMPNRLNCEEQKVLLQFLEVLSGVPCAESLTMYDTYTGVPTGESYDEYLKRIKEIDNKNERKLADYFAKCALGTANPDLLKEKIDNLKLIGFESRERQYLDSVLSSSFVSEKTLCDLLIRNVALGHVKLVESLIKTPQAAALLTQAILPNGGGLLEVAVKNDKKEMVKFLLSKNCNPLATNHEGISPLEMATTNQAIKLELSNFKTEATTTTRKSLHFSAPKAAHQQEHQQEQIATQEIPKNHQFKP